MNIKILVLGIIVALGMILGLAVSVLTKTALGPSATTCIPIQFVAVGGCDGDGVCGVVAVTKEGEVVKGKAAYPIAGLIDCRESIHE